MGIDGGITYFQETMDVTEEGNTFCIKGKGGAKLKCGKEESGLSPTSQFGI